MLAPLAILGALQAIREEFLSQEQQQALRILNFVPQLPWWVWVIMGLCVAVFIILESAYRQIKELRNRADDLNDSIEATESEFQACLEPRNRTLAMRITNISRVPATITARAQARRELGIGSTEQTAEFILTWEERPGTVIVVNPKDHVIAQIATYVTRTEDNRVMHEFALHSANRDVPHKFPFGTHASDQSPVTAKLTVTIYADPVLRGIRQWHFRMSDKHPKESWQFEGPMPLASGKED